MGYLYGGGDRRCAHEIKMCVPRSQYYMVAYLQATAAADTMVVAIVRCHNRAIETNTIELSV